MSILCYQLILILSSSLSKKCYKFQLIHQIINISPPRKAPYWDVHFVNCYNKLFTNNKIFKWKKYLTMNSTFGREISLNFVDFRRSRLLLQTNYQTNYQYTCNIREVCVCVCFFLKSLILLNSVKARRYRLLNIVKLVCVCVCFEYFVIKNQQRRLISE